MGKIWGLTWLEIDSTIVKMKLEKEHKAFCWPVRVYHEDVDTMGIVYYANYLRFLERARTEWLRSMGIDQGVLHEEEGVWLVVRSVQLDYHQSAKYDDLLEITVRVLSHTKTSVELEQSVCCDGRLLLSSVVRIVCVRECSVKAGKTQLRPAAIPVRLINAWKAYL